MVSILLGLVLLVLLQLLLLLLVIIMLLVLLQLLRTRKFKARTRLNRKMCAQSSGVVPNTHEVSD